MALTEGEVREEGDSKGYRCPQCAPFHVAISRDATG